MMNKFHDRKRRTQQALLVGAFVCALASTTYAQEEGYEPEKDVDIQTIVPSDANKDEKPLRFGDPGSFLIYGNPQAEAEEEEEKDAEPTFPVKETVSTNGRTSSLASSPADRVRAIIASIPPEQEYPQEFEELVRIGDEGVPMLVEIFRDVSAPWQSRWVAAMALGRIGGFQAKMELEQGVGDPLFLIRMAAVTALGNLNDVSSAPAVRVALDDKALVVRAAAVTSLGELRDRGAVKLLTKELQAGRNFHRGKGLWIREKILNALVRIGDPKSVPTIVSLLGDENSTMRIRACHALVHLFPQSKAAESFQGESCGERWRKWYRAEYQKKG